MKLVQSAAWAAGILTLISTGCMRPAGIVFPQPATTIAWPLPPAAPRIRFVGELRSSTDLKPARTGWQTLSTALGGSSTQPISFTTPSAIATGPDNRIYVVDTAAAGLHIIDLTRRTHVRILEANGQRLRSPVGVAVGNSRVYVSDAVLGGVFEFDLAGAFRRRIGANIKRPGGVAFCPANHRLYVVDTGDHRCVVFDEDGQEYQAFGERGSQSGAFNYPTHITYHPSVGILISDTLNFRVQRFTPDGTFVSALGKKGDAAGDFSLPKGLAVDSDGHIYVVDAHFENVQVFRPDGQLLLAFGGEGSGHGEFSIPSGLAINGHNRIWVADSHNSRVQVMEYISRTQP